MRPRRLLWQLQPPIVAILCVSVFAIGAFALGLLRDFHFDQTQTTLTAQAELVRRLVLDRLQMSPSRGLDSLAKEVGRATSTRITIVRENGLVLGDTDEDPESMDNHARRPEVVAALRDGYGFATRWSDTLAQNMVYRAVTLEPPSGSLKADSDTESGSRLVIRAAVPLTALETALRGVTWRIGLAGFGVAVVATLLSLLIASRISRPLEQLRRTADRYAAGDLSARLPAAGSEEVAGLAEAMNAMAAQLDERMRRVIEQANEREAVLAAMSEAVLAVDREDCVLTMNRAAAMLFDVELETALGSKVQGLAQNPELLEFIHHALRRDTPTQTDVTFFLDNEQKYLQANGAPLMGADGRRAGVVVVLNDVTRLHRLEAVRRDFVANVSHELKTPVTSIKGFIETLADGAIDDPETARRFLEILGRQSERLSRIIEDLLSLSRLEQDRDEQAIPMERGPLDAVLAGAMEICRGGATAKHVEVRCEAEDGILVEANGPLLEQALVNLIDNAVKYSEDGSSVTVKLAAVDGLARLTVTDEGVGIPAEHLPRLFERFYRVDKARSRDMGGTGLGLAIVKHIVAAHGGRVRVESTVGVGSTFFVELPLA